MTCQDVGLELLEDEGQRSAAAEAHLRSCKRCREVLGAHRSAIGLRHLPWQLPASPSAPPARTLWRRRFAVRGLLALLVIAGFGVAITNSTEPVADPQAGQARIDEASLPEVPANPSSSFEALLLEVDSYTSDQVSADDPSLAPFGELPSLLTPPAKSPKTVSSVLSRGVGR